MARANADWLSPNGSMKSCSKISPGWTGGSFLVFIASRIVNDFNVVRILALPAETEPILIVGAQAVLAGPVAAQGFQPVSRRHPQIPQVARTVQLRQFAERNPLDLRRQSVMPQPHPEFFGLCAGETDNHPLTLSRHDMM